jgi:flavin reductase (DIM6/NTAB) family NADH-FMN oxidoreductase RutF
MKRLVGAALHGQPLRHRAIALRRDEQRPVRVALETGGRDSAGAAIVFPAALKPFTIGLSLDATAEDGSDAGWRLRLEDVATGAVVSRIDTALQDTIANGDATIRLLRPTRSDVACERAPYLLWRHFLAWRHTRRGARRPHNLQMSFPDLRALNAFYVLPRPVFLVSVAAGERSNLFPMDLVTTLGRDGFVLALRRTSPSIETMCASRRVVISAAPAALKETVYRLGAHHKTASMDWNTLPFPLAPSSVYGIPRPADSPIVNELHIAAFDEIGSHMLFRCRIVSQEIGDDMPQLCHVSDMYARWRERQGTPFVDA